jgi:uncharacterized protein YciI
MPMYALHCLDKPGAFEKRIEVRPRHLEYVKGTGKVRLGGPYLNEQGQPVGSLIIVEVADAAEAEAFSLADPYRREGVFETVEIRPWSYTAGQLP